MDSRIEQLERAVPSTEPPTTGRRIKKFEHEYELAKQIADVVDAYLQAYPNVDICRVRIFAETMVNNY